MVIYVETKVIRPNIEVQFTQRMKGSWVEEPEDREEEGRGGKEEDFFRETISDFAHELPNGGR